jgi:hypothetical protein
MNSLSKISVIIYTLTLLFPTTISQCIAEVAGGGPPNDRLPALITDHTITQFQLALFLENLESNFLQAGLQNMSSWAARTYTNGTTDNLKKIAAVLYSRHIVSFEKLIF